MSPDVSSVSRYFFCGLFKLDRLVRLREQTMLTEFNSARTVSKIAYIVFTACKAVHVPVKYFRYESGSVFDGGILLVVLVFK